MQDLHCFRDCSLVLNGSLLLMSCHLLIPHLCAVLPPFPLYLVAQKGSIGVLTCVSVRPRQEGSGAVGSRGAALIQPAVVAGDSNGGVWVLRRTPSTDA
jgi:hypothetical protein